MYTSRSKGLRTYSLEWRAGSTVLVDSDGTPGILAVWWAPERLLIPESELPLTTLLLLFCVLHKMDVVAGEQWYGRRRHGCGSLDRSDGFSQPESLCYDQR